MSSAAAAIADLCLFGGAFDPPHRAHDKLIRAAFAQLPITRLIVLPSGVHPLKPSAVAPVDDRLELCRLAFADIAGVEISDFDARRPGPCFTVDTLAHFREYASRGRRPFWLVGSDNLAILPQWHRAHDVLRLGVLVTYPRAGHPIDAQLLATAGLTAAERAEITHYALQGTVDDLAATEIRRRLASGEDVRDWLHPAVARHIGERGLYGSRAPMIAEAWLVAPASAVALAAALRTNARWFGFLPIDPPRPGRKAHAVPLPMLGIVLGALATTAFAAFASPLATLGIALCAGVGYVDDRAKQRLCDLSAPGKAIVLAAAAALAVASVNAALPPTAWCGATVLAFVVINALNFLDNTNGAAVAVGGAGLLLAADAPGLPLVLGGLFLGFLPFNWPTPRALLGDAGSLTLGYALAYCALTRGVGADDLQWRALLAPVAVPVVDFAQVVCARVWLGFRPWVGDRRHLTHIAVYAGLPPALVAPLFAALAVASFALID